MGLSAYVMSTKEASCSKSGQDSSFLEMTETFFRMLYGTDLVLLSGGEGLGVR